MFELIYRYDPTRPTDRHPPASADEARRRLEDGNRGFANLGEGTPDASRVVYIDPEHFGVAAMGGVPKQQPFAVVLGCSDARVPIELLFDRSCNELFVVRVAGNTLGQEQLGSIGYAVEYLGANLKLIVVLGHSKCGAVKAAVDSFMQPGEYFGLLSSHHIRAIVNNIFPAVRGAAAALAAKWGDDVVTNPGYRAALLQSAVAMNAALKASILYEEFHDPGKDLRVVFGVYDLATRRVGVARAAPADADSICLLDALPSLDAFRQFALEIASHAAIAQLLGSGQGAAS
jgi:carbonic anhydrase